MIKRFLGITLAVLMLTACSFNQRTDDPAVDAYVNAVRDVTTACAGYNGAMEQIVIMRNLGQLSTETRANVTAIRNEVGTTCETEDPPLYLSDGRSTLALIKDMTARLLLYKGGQQ